MQTMVECITGHTAPPTPPPPSCDTVKRTLCIVYRLVLSALCHAHPWYWVIIWYSSRYTSVSGSATVASSFLCTDFSCGVRHRNYSRPFVPWCDAAVRAYSVSTIWSRDAHLHRIGPGDGGKGQACCQCVATHRGDFEKAGCFNTSLPHPAEDFCHRWCDAPRTLEGNVGSGTVARTHAAAPAHVHEMIDVVLLNTSQHARPFTVNVTVRVTGPPASHHPHLAIPAFFDTSGCPNTSGCWRFRFTPDVAGAWHYVCGGTPMCRENACDCCSCVVHGGGDRVWGSV